MEAARPPRRRRRSRRGTVDRPVNGRLVRAAGVLVVFPLLAFVFSVTPARSLPPALEPAFDGAAAAALAAQLSTEYPSRVPGTPEADAAAHWYRETMDALGLPTEQDVWREHLPGVGEVQLRNLITVVPGRSPEAILLVAHRDNAGAGQGLGDNASGTAALIELARGFAPVGSSPPPKPQRTLVFLSTDGGAFGGAGAARFADVSPYSERVLAAVVLEGLGGEGRPRVAVAGRGAVSPARALVASAVARIAEQTGVEPVLPSPLQQLADLALPYAAGEQGPLLARGIAAVTIARTEPGRPIPTGRREGAISAARLGQLGRATEALAASLDASARAGFGTPDTLFLHGRTASGWAARLVLVVAVVPFVLATLDLLVRARRRGLPLAAALRALRTRTLVWLSAVPLVWLAGLAGILPTGASLPLPPYSPSVTERHLAGLVALGLACALVWLAGRRWLAPGQADATAEERLAGYAVALAWLAAVGAGLALTKPYALAFVLPSLYAWLWLPARTRLAARAGLYLLGLLGPFLGLLALARELHLGLLDTVHYLLALASIGYLTLPTVLLALAWAAGAGQLAALAFGRYAPYARGLEPPPAGLVRRAARRVARRPAARLRRA